MDSNGFFYEPIIDDTFFCCIFWGEGKNVIITHEKQKRGKSAQ